jgi:hypothetical protein
LIIGLIAGLLLVYWLATPARKSMPKRSAAKSFQNPTTAEGIKAKQYGSSHHASYVANIPLKSRGGSAGPFVDSGRRKSDFTYPDNPNPSEFLAYFIASEKLNALKIGVGTSGRVIQLLSSTVKTEDGIENVGWKVLKTARFSLTSADYETGRNNGYEAEARVLYYWRKHLGKSPYVTDQQMGWSELIYQGRKGWHLTKGFTETVELGSVCEVSTWNIIQNAPGFQGEGSTFFVGRDLRVLDLATLSSTIAPGYYEYRKNLQAKASSRAEGALRSADSDYNPAERMALRSSSDIPRSAPLRKNKPMPSSDGTKNGKFWTRVKKESSGGCWNWIGSIAKDTGYGQMHWEGRRDQAHRISWQLHYGSMPEGDFLMNMCGTKACVNPDHWELRTLRDRKCMSPDCDGISRTTMVDGLCAQCERSRIYLYRKARPNPYKCTNAQCMNPSGTVAFASKCQKCRR